MHSKEFDNFVNYDFRSFSDWLFSLNPYEFSMIAVLMGVIISPTLTINQQNSLGNFLELLGQVILTINAQATTLGQSSRLHNLEIEINKLKEEIVRLKNNINKN